MDKNYEFELITKLMRELNTLLMPNHARNIPYLSHFDYEKLELAHSVLECLYENYDRDGVYHVE